MPVYGHGIRPALSVRSQVPGYRIQAVRMSAVIPAVTDNLRRLGGQLVAPAPAMFLVVQVVILVAEKIGRLG